MAPRAALYLMPSLAVFATAALVLGPGRERPAVGARVWGMPAEGAKVAAWRLETMERQFGADRALPIDGMDLSVQQGGRRIAAWSGSSGDDGIAEALLRADEPLAGTLEVHITRGTTALAGGTIALRRPSPITRERLPANGTAHGPIHLRVEVARGVLAAPFPGSLHIVATRDGAPAEGIRLSAALAGAAPIPPNGTEAVTDASGRADLPILPQWHAVGLKLEATDPRADPPTKSTWEGDLPVRPGALWLGLSRPMAEIASPVPRGRVHVSAIGENGRVFGQIVPLQKSASGLFEATLDTSTFAGLGALAITVAGDPTEQGAGTVTWPLHGADAVTSAPRVELMLDGVPFAERLEKKRAGAARLASVGVALVAAVFEAVLLLLHSRASQAQLAAHLATVAEEGGDGVATARIAQSPASRAFSLVVALGLIVLAFGAVAAFAIVR